MGVPGSNPGGPIIFQRKIEGCQSHPARGEKGLGQGWVCRGRISRSFYAPNFADSEGASQGFAFPIIFQRKIEGRLLAMNLQWKACKTYGESGILTGLV